MNKYSNIFLMTFIIIVNSVCRQYLDKTMELADLIVLDDSAIMDTSNAGATYKVLSNINLNVSVILDRNCNSSRQLLLYQGSFKSDGKTKTYKQFYAFDVMLNVKIPINFEPRSACSSSSTSTCKSIWMQMDNCKCITQPTVFITISPPAYICYEYTFNYEYTIISSYSGDIQNTSGSWSIPTGLSTKPNSKTN